MAAFCVSVLVGCLVFGAGLTTASAQPTLQSRWSAPVAASARPVDANIRDADKLVGSSTSGLQDAAPAPWIAPVFSALLPGAGQGMLRQQRGVLYGAIEGYLILQAVRSNRDASRERDAYREIARTVARGASGSARPDGAWPYYETMQYVLESGAYNATPGNGFTPEADPTTFNGSIWLLARETYWRDPDVAPDAGSAEFQRAIDFYQRRAAGEDFLWSWRDAQLEQDLYRQTIDRANEASRRTRQVVGLLLANHALSLVDAYMTVRLRVYGTPAVPGVEQQFGVMGTVPLPGMRRD